MENFMTIGDRIRNYRKLSGMTQKQLGDASGTSERTIQQYEQGKRQPRIEQLCKIANVLNVSTSDLLGNEQDKNIWSYHLEEDLKRIGCRLGSDEEDAYLWIEMPDGTLEVRDTDLIELEESTTSFFKFKLEELKRKNPDNFRPRKK